VQFEFSWIINVVYFEVKIDASCVFFMFQMRRSLFLRIVEDVMPKNLYFVQKRDVCHRLSFSPLQKCTTTIKMLTYGGLVHFLDDVIWMGESIIHE
jgi:hypothetical protein